MPLHASPARCRSGARLFIILAAALALAACSSTTFFYNRLDTFIHWAVDDYVDFDASQEARFEKELDQLLLWHRREELPRYIEVLDEIDGLLDSPLTPEDLARLLDTFQAAAERLQLRVVDMMMVMGEHLTPEQRKAFLTALQEEQVEDREKYLTRTDEEWRERLIERFEDNLTEFTGRLTPEQRGLIEAASREFIRLDGAWLDTRDRWLAQLATILEQHETDWQAPVRAVLDGRKAARPVEYQAALDSNLEHTRRLILEVLNSRTAKQDKRLRRNLRDYRADFAELVAELESEVSQAETSP